MRKHTPCQRHNRSVKHRDVTPRFPWLNPRRDDGARGALYVAFSMSRVCENRRIAGRSSGGVRFLADWQANDEGSSASHCALHADTSLVCVDDLFAGGESQSCAAFA